MATAWLELSRTPPARSLASLAANKPLPVDGVFIAAPVLALCFFPIAAFAIAFAFHSLPPFSEEAAHLFGDKIQALRRFYWPLLRPAIYGAMGVCGALAMWEMGACDLLDARTYSVEIYRAFNAGGEDTVAALRSLPMLFIGALLLFPALRALKFYGQRDNFARRDALVTNAGKGAFFVSVLLFCVGGWWPALCIHAASGFDANILRCVAEQFGRIKKHYFAFQHSGAVDNDSLALCRHVVARLAKTRAKNGVIALRFAAALSADYLGNCANWFL